jgi:hypothetical protein
MRPSVHAAVLTGHVRRHKVLCFRHRQEEHGVADHAASTPHVTWVPGTDRWLPGQGPHG